MVFWHHWMPPLYNRGMNWGASGVHFFFVLSGFLITGILLRCRNLQEQGLQPPRRTIRQFYARRFLRIFPLYYAVLIPVFLFMSFDTGTKISLLTYTYNLYAGLTGKLGSSVTHFWSLAVEEQFYIFWPVIILLTPKRALPAALIATTAIGPIARTLFLCFGDLGNGGMVMTPSCLDSLGGGALAAFAVQRWGLERVLANRWFRLLGFVGLVFFMAGIFLKLSTARGDQPAVWQVLVMSTRAPLFIWVVLRAARGFRGPLGKLLASRVMNYLGRISYGLYVYHPFVYLLLVKKLHIRGLHPVVGFAIAMVATVMVADLSWRLLETPINRLKRHFPYRVPSPKTP